MLRQEAGIQVDKFYPPTDWLDNNNKQIDIRKNAENNSIVLLVGHSADFTEYSLLGLLADTSSGTYDVYIDDVLVGSGITKNTLYNIDFSTINTSYGSATTPEEFVLHKIVIKPTTNGATITAFHCARTTGASGTQYNGILWCHFELSNRFSLNQAFAGDTDTYRSARMRAITAQNDLLKPTSLYNSFYRCTALRYIPIIDGIGNAYNIYRFVYNCSNLKRICFRDFNNNSNSTTSFALCSVLEQIQCNNSEIGIAREGFDSLYSLKLIPNKKIYSLQQSVTNATKLQPTKIDASSYTTLTKIGLYGTSTYPMRGLRGLKVSNEAPFSGTSPQIDVSYTGLDREALVELFNSLPAFMSLTAVGSPTINNGVVSGFSSSDYLEKATSISLSTQELEVVLDITMTSFASEGLCFFSTNTFNVQFYSQSTTYKKINLGGSQITGTKEYLLNTNYKIKLKFYVVGSSIHLDIYYLEGSDWVLDASYTNLSYITINKFILGDNYSHTGTRVFTGSYNLNNSYMILDGTKYTFLLPSATTRTLKCVGATGNNLTKVGSPTIDENGVASGFSTSDYLRCGQIPNTKIVEYNIKIKTGTIGNIERIFGESGSSSFGGLSIVANGKLSFSLKRLSGYTDIPFDITLLSNTIYTINIKFEEGIIRLFVYDENGNKIYEEKKEVSYTEQLAIIVCFGMGSGTRYFSGTIYLEETYIKEFNNFIMKGYLTDTDKNIALNKGWALTLS